jgi:iron complex transport system substrate-binding protein
MRGSRKILHGRLRQWGRTLAAIVAAGIFAAPGLGYAGQRVVSLDNCADEYVLGLMPADQVAGVSDRATLPESYYADRARSFPRVHPTLESLLALHPDTVVRTWGGDVKLLEALKRRGINIITINDVNTYSEAKDELMRVGHLLGQDGQAAAEARAMMASLDGTQRIGQGRTVLYYTPSGYSAGPDTFIGEMLRTLGYRLETADHGFFYLSPEVLLSTMPDVFALGFYDDPYQSRRAPGRSALIRERIDERPHIALSGRMIACSGWYTAYDLEALSRNGVS